MHRDIKQTKHLNNENIDNGTIKREREQNTMAVPAAESVGKEIKLSVFYFPRKKRTFQEALRIHIATQEFIIRLHSPTQRQHVYVN